MEKKDKMLQYIKSNVNWFMTTENSVRIIGYNELTNYEFNNIRQYIASGVEEPDIVCMISTSIFDTCKSGILFTTDYVYSKAWGGFLTSNCKNSIYSASTAKFDVTNEFDVSRMRVIMSKLADIAEEEDKKDNHDRKVKGNIKKVGKIASGVTLAAMAAVEIINEISKNVVSQNNEKISKEVADLESEDNLVSRIFEDFTPLFDELMEILDETEKKGRIDDETMVSFIESLKNIFTELSNRSIYYMDPDTEDEDYDEDELLNEFNEWVGFWANTFYDGDEFDKDYDDSKSEKIHSDFINAALLMDYLLENENWDPVFSEILREFGETVLRNNEEIDSISDDESDEAIERYDELLESNIEAFKSVIEAIEEATDCLETIKSDFDGSSEDVLLDNDFDSEYEIVLSIYDDFFPLLKKLTDKLEEEQNEEDYDEETVVFIIECLIEIFSEFYNETCGILYHDKEDVDYIKNKQRRDLYYWTNYWSNAFYTGDEYEKDFDSKRDEMLSLIFIKIAKMADEFLDDEDWDPSFSEILSEFGEEIFRNEDEINKISLNEDNYSEEEHRQKMNELIVSRSKALESLLSDVDNAIHCFQALISESEDDSMEEDADSLYETVMEIYGEFGPMVDEFCEILAENLDEDMDDETIYSVLNLSKDIFVELYDQTLEYLDITPNDEKYPQYIQWISFWASVFYDGDEFREYYPIDEFSDIPEKWEILIDFADGMTKDEEWDSVFSDIIYDFGNTVVNNFKKVADVANSSNGSDKLDRMASKITSSNNHAVYLLNDALDKVTDLLIDALSEDE